MASHFTQEQGCKCEVAFFFTTKIHKYYMHGRITNKCAMYTRESDGFLTMLSSSTFLAKMSLVSWVHSSSIHVLSRRQHRGYNILMMMMVMTMVMVAMIGSNISES